MSIRGTSMKSSDSPRGPVAIDPATRDVIENVYINKTEKLNGRLANVQIGVLKDVKDPWKELNPE